MKPKSDLMQISFAKWHGYGNDFLVVESAPFQETWLAAFTRFMCQPHVGLGADGCVFVRKCSECDFNLRIFNRDGSEAGMSGNGFRCAAAQIHRSGQSASSSLVLHTRSGKKPCQLLGQKSATRWSYLSDLGEPLFSPPEVPCLVNDREVVSEYPVRVEGHQLLLNALSVGNPQCAILVERLPGPEQFQLLGSKLERHSLFPERTNVSFVQVISREQLSIQIWERGVGPTSSSGTGSCGAAVTAIRLGLVDSPVAVETRAGSQQVAWSPGKSVLLTGDAELVADGRCYWEP